jgi:hypothetical protein
MVESHNFLTRDNLDLTPYNNKIYRWVLDKDEFDFENSNPKSRLSISFYISVHGGDTVCSFKSSGSNCAYLKNIIDKYIMPNVLP